MLSTCPPAAALTLFAAGDLTDAELAAVGEHLDTCARCRAALDAVPALFESTSFPVLLEPRGPDPVLKRAFELVHLIPPPSGEEPPPEPAPPTHCGRFRVLRRLGAGGMGIVYEAEDEHLGRRVAVKVLRPAFAARAGARDRFLREARATAALQHPNVVAILEVGEADAGPYLVMELLSGESLGARLRRTRLLPVADAVRVGKEVAAGLAAAHARGLIHRDVTPDNIWLVAKDEGGTGFAPGSDSSFILPPSSFERVKLLDFGLVRAGGDDAATTTPGTIVGTPRYMSPEQARATAVDHRADVFGLGAVLYHALTGTFPFPGNDTLAVLSALAMHTPAPANHSNPAVPRRVAAVVARMMAKRPDDRPPNAAAVVAELTDALVPRKRRWWLVAPLLAVTAAAAWLATRPGDPPVVPIDDPPPAVVTPVVLPKELAVAPPPWEVPGEPPPADADRVAAEWAMSNTAAVAVVLECEGRQFKVENEAHTGRKPELPDGPYQLLHVNVNRNRVVTDEHAVHFRGLKNLTFLQASNVRITDAFLPHLRHSRKLETLLLYATGITDAGLPHLEGFVALRELNVRQTRVTDIGLRKLSAKLPRCRVTWNGGVIGPVEGK